MGVTCNNISSTSSSLNSAPSVTRSSKYTIIINNLYDKEVYIWASIPCDGYNGEYLTVRVETISGWESYKRTYNLTNGQYYSVITAYSVETDNKVIAVEMVFSNVPNGANHIEFSYYTDEDPTDHNYYWKIASPSVTAPGTPTITQNNDGTFKASWSASTGSNGSGSVTYQLWNVTNGIAASSSLTATSVTLDIPIYGTAIEYKVVATYSGKTSSSGIATKTFTKPSLSTPTNVKLSATTGESTTISWTASSITATAVSGSIIYSIRKNGTEIKTTTSTSYTFNKDTTSTWGTSAVTLTVVATASTVNKHYPSLTSSASSGVSFTYKKPYQTISYYTNNNFIPCKVYYYTNNSWVLCNIHYYTNGLWKPCSTT